MKYILLSIYILLIPFSFVYAQEEEPLYEEQTIEESIQEEEEYTTLQEEVVPLSVKLSPLEIAFAILAPLVFILIGYLLIKNFKL